ncbi:hypothetical protein [Acidimangrovimonas sediminis]|uniref:hypothetical protein n=1 Tax=Acidimangrovimonas sediminis TaxID=2056283 RepID=UPI0018EDA7F7|nr:hypothetical protein [Acidimangrovimonas sediminis]
MTESMTGPRTSARAGTGAAPGAATLIAVAALVALVITAWRYFTPLSGVTGTAGALLTMVGDVALLIGGIVLALLPGGGWRVLFLVLAWIGGLLTLLATVLLHGWSSAAALVVLLLALLIATFVKGPAKGTHP